MDSDDSGELIDTYYNSERSRMPIHAPQIADAVVQIVSFDFIWFCQTQRDLFFRDATLLHSLSGVPAVFNQTTGPAHQNCRKNLTSFR
jgi:hypothetical protein